MAVLLVLLSSSVYAQGNKVKISFLWWSDPGGGFERVVKDFERENPGRVALSRAIAKRPRAFPVKLIMSEKLGNILVLNLKWRDTVLRVSSTKKEKDDITHDLWVEFDRHKVLFFDTVTGKLLED